LIERHAAKLLVSSAALLKNHFSVLYEQR